MSQRMLSSKRMAVPGYDQVMKKETEMGVVDLLEKLSLMSERLTALHTGQDTTMTRRSM